MRFTFGGTLDVDLLQVKQACNCVQPERTDHFEIDIEMLNATSALGNSRLHSNIVTREPDCPRPRNIIAPHRNLHDASL